MNINYIEVPKPGTLTQKAFMKVASYGDWFIQPKMDGHHRVLYKNLDGHVCAFGLRFSDVTFKREDVLHKLGKEVQAIASRLNPGQAVSGEVFVPGKTSTDIARYMKEDPDSLQFLAFNVLLLDDKYYTGQQDVALESHSKFLGVPCCESRRLTHSEIVRLVSNFDDAYSDLSDQAEAAGLEGYVIKARNGLPQFKFKREETLDLVVTGTTQANFGLTGKYSGLIGALVCKTSDGHEVCQISGMTDELRRSFTQNPPIGCVVEVRCQGFAANGRLRHPRFKQTRPDKSASMADTLASAKEKCK